MTVYVPGRRIRLSSNALQIIDAYRQRSERAPEAGGVLLGQVNHDESRVLIDRVSLPTRADTATRHSFRRDRKWAQGVIEYEFCNSGGRTIYLGEWHTHPAQQAVPSERDRTMIREQFRANDMNVDFALLIIAGIDDLYVGVYDGSCLARAHCHGESEAYLAPRRRA